MRKEDVREGMKVIMVHSNKPLYKEGDIGIIKNTSSYDGTCEIYFLEKDDSLFVYPYRFEPLKEKEERFEVGDKVRLRDDLTLKEVRESHVIVRSEMWRNMRKGCFEPVVSSVSVNERFGFSVISLKNGDGWSWDISWFEIVEKAPKTLYYDARKTAIYRIGMTARSHHIQLHGLTKKEAEEIVGEPINYDSFVEEEPEPLSIIKGNVK